MSPASEESSHEALRSQFLAAGARFRALITRHLALQLAYLAGAALVFFVCVSVHRAAVVTLGLAAIGAVGWLLFPRLGRIGPAASRAASELARIGAELPLTRTSPERHVYPSRLIGPLVGPLVFLLLVAHLAVSIGATFAALVRVYSLSR